MPDDIHLSNSSIRAEQSVKIATLINSHEIGPGQLPENSTVAGCSQTGSRPKPKLKQ
ncbi:MAG TPA: hypothetical protein VFQ61_10310 [Polyangiaceae bacterium]|nr:hypothetical protein [Polyangiaceae bacterium]